MNTEALKNVAKKHGATVTTYILALMFIAGKFATESFDGDMCIQVPVNMRKFYPSKTLLNFSMYSAIRMPLNADYELKTLIT